MVAAGRSDGTRSESGSLCRVVGANTLSDSDSPASHDLYSWKESDTTPDLRVEALVEQLKCIANIDNPDLDHYTREPTVWDQAFELNSCERLVASILI